MSSGIISQLIENIENENEESLIEQFTIISVRPNEKVLAMLNIMTELSGRNYSSEISRIISSQLLNEVCSSIEYAEPILNAAEQVFNTGDHYFDDSSVLSYLGRNKYLDYDFTGFSAQIKLAFSGSLKTKPTTSKLSDDKV